MQLCAGKTNLNLQPLQFVLDRMWLGLCAFTKTRGDLETQAPRFCCLHGCGWVSREHIHLQCHLGHRLLGLNSRERTWREWISFCPKYRGSPSKGGLGHMWEYLVFNIRGSSGEQPVLSLNVLCRESPSHSHMLRGPWHKCLLPGTERALGSSLAMEESTLLPRIAHGPSQHPDMVMDNLSITPVP